MFVPPRHYSRTKKGKCLSPVLNEVTAASKPAAKALHRRSPELSTLTVLSSSLNTLDSKAWLTIHIHTLCSGASQKSPPAPVICSPEAVTVEGFAVSTKAQYKWNIVALLTPTILTGGSWIFFAVSLLVFS